MQEGLGVTNFQTKLNYLNSFKTCCNFSDLGFLRSGGGAGGWGYLGRPAIVYMSSGVFRGKESSNRIELSWLVQDLLNFGVLGSLWLWGRGVGGLGWRVAGGCPHTCTHAHACTHTHACMVNMTISCKWPPHWGNPWEFPMMSYAHVCVYACMNAYACAHVWQHPSTLPHPYTPTPPHEGPRISKNSIALELIEIFQFCLKILKFVESPPHMARCMVWVGLWVGWWVGSGKITKNLKNVDWIKIIQFCLKINDL